MRKTGVACALAVASVAASNLDSTNTAADTKYVVLVAAIRAVPIASADVARKSALLNDAVSKLNEAAIEYQNCIAKMK